MARGHSQTSIEGDVAQQGGSMLVARDGTLGFYYRNEDLGDHVNPSDFIDAVFKMRGSSQDNILI